jgi:cytosolic carboxypeptidase protein 2/3
MLNPDGVIAGNTRTGVAGKDLNRQYRKSNEIVFPEVISIIDYVMRLK